MKKEPEPREKQGISRGLKLVMDRLAKGQHVPLDTIYETLEVRLAEGRAQRPRTNPNDPARGNLQMAAYNAVMAQGSFTGKDPSGQPMYTGAVTKGHEYHLMFGLPASGKSTIADRLSQASRSRIMDSDYVKEQIPEFEGGWGADAVHKESKHILKMALSDALDQGDNLVVPKLGSPPDQMLDLLRNARDKGYKCYVHCVDLDPNKSMGRMLGRFLSTGRYIPPKIAGEEIGANGENKVMESFKTVVESGVCDGWTLWSNDVPMGEKPVLMGYGANPDESIQKLIEGADMDISRVIGCETESPDHAGDAIDQIYQAIDTDEAEAAGKSAELRAKSREIAMRDASKKTGGSMMDRILQMNRERDARDDASRDGIEVPGE